MWARLVKLYILALHLRINGHRHDIAHRRIEDSPVAAHFNSDAHSQTDMAVMVIDQVNSRDPCLRKIRESPWIRTLETVCSLWG